MDAVTVGTREFLAEKSFVLILYKRIEFNALNAYGVCALCNAYMKTAMLMWRRMTELLAVSAQSQH